MANALRLTANGGCEYIDNTNARTGKNITALSFKLIQ